MDRERWQKVKQILEDAVELARDEQAGFVSDVCGDDADLRVEVISLLNETEAAESLETSAYRHVVPNDDRLLNTKIGNYRLVERIGSGGMGTVYLAERADGAFEQNVALKLIKRGMDSDEILRRFVTERQILASLKHPNIAHLIDGGTTADGLPFLVMEYVEGSPITEYIKIHGLNLEARLDLFREVCAAVSFAHQKLVIHRDLKPLNILITSDGKAKLLDFGIAKLVKSDKNDETQTNTFAFTPEYASPEQIRGESLSTATDVYSLGVVLYELLTGIRPFKFEGKNFGEIVRTISETAPLKPSATDTLEIPDEGELKARFSSTRLRGDIDNIVLKTLNKDPARRYSSVEQFSEDIRRHLKGLPVLARQDSWSYRAEKFTRRNPLVVGSIGLAFVILLVGIIATTYQSRRANIERERAERRFNDVRTLANSFIFEINDKIADSPIEARELLVKRGLEYLDNLSVEAENDIGLQSELANAYEKIGDLQGELFSPNLGKTTEALASHQKALTLRERLYKADQNIERAANVATSHMRLGDIYTMNGQTPEMLASYRNAIEILESAVAKEPANRIVRKKLGSSLAALGQATLRSGSLEDTFALYQRSLAVFEQLQAEAPADLGYRRSVGIVHSYIGFIYYEQNNFDEAVNSYGRWLEIEKQIVNAEPDVLSHQSHLSTAYTWYGMMLAEKGEMDKAIEHLAKGSAIMESSFARDPKNLGERMSLADANLEEGKILIRVARSRDAVNVLTRSLEHFQAIGILDKNSLWTTRRIGFTQRFLADAQLAGGDRSNALKNYQSSLATAKQLNQQDPLNVEWQQDLGMSFMRIGEYYLKFGDRVLARSHFAAAQTLFEALLRDSPTNRNRKKDLEKINRLIETAGP